MRRKLPTWAPSVRVSRNPTVGVLSLVVLYVIFFRHSQVDVDVESKQQQRHGHGRMTYFREQLPQWDTSSGLPNRLQKMVQKGGGLIGDHLAGIKSGSLTAEEALHGSKSKDEENSANHDDPMPLDDVIGFLSRFISELHELSIANKGANFVEVWKMYHDLVVKTLYPWDREYLKRMPSRRFDGSIFLSLASYRDENCLSTISNAYSKAKRPELLFVGLVQQNCEENCRSGVLAGGGMENVEPDDDCHRLFCESEEGKPHCDAGRVRALHIQEAESLGPYAARYFASKLWYGEQWYMQIDSHMTYAQDWDAISLEMLHNAPSKKPVISHYPPPHTSDLDAHIHQPAPRLCSGEFATSSIESQIIRLSGSGSPQKQISTPRFAPVVAAGYFVASAEFLSEVPFDPFLPWIFMGEEIIMSARLWTSGYDIFSPTSSVVGHIYVRRHKPKFWESVHRVFHMGVHNPLQMMILDRVKYQLTYPEAARDMLKIKTILTAVEQYSMGKTRSLEDYLDMVGLDMTKKESYRNDWCNSGTPPKGFESFDYLY